ncbi:MAG: TetR/AcrR family transcriptional regulator [Bacteroidales bacterium]|nr:TetR/AcrR family transcriptional regulator [Bacteroidales bacterium]
MSETRRPRRTKADIEKRINDAAVELITQKGFADVQLTEITRKADIEPMVFYNRYHNMDEFYDEFVKKYDYWLTDVIKQQGTDTTEPSEENCAEIMDGLITELISDKIMLEILRWEVGSGNPVTERTALFREMLNLQLVFKYKKLFREGNSPIDIAAFSALIIGGIYYQFLHRDRSSFCGLDFNDPKDIEIMRNTVSQLVKLVFSTLNINKQQ